MKGNRPPCRANVWEMCDNSVLILLLIPNLNCQCIWCVHLKELIYSVNCCIAALLWVFNTISIAIMQCCVIFLIILISLIICSYYQHIRTKHALKYWMIDKLIFFMHPQFLHAIKPNYPELNNLNSAIQSTVACYYLSHFN